MYSFEGFSKLGLLKYCESLQQSPYWTHSKSHIQSLFSKVSRIVVKPGLFVKLHVGSLLHTLKFSKNIANHIYEPIIHSCITNYQLHVIFFEKSTNWVCLGWSTICVLQSRANDSQK